MLSTVESGVTDTEILLGSSAVLSGPLGSQIKVVLNGAALAFDAANEQGGVGGRKIELAALDDELKPEKALENYGKLLNDHRVFAFFGCVGPGTTSTPAKLLQQSGAPSVGGYGTPYPWGEVEAVTRDYRRLAERAQVPVGYGSFEGYLNGLVMIKAIKRTGRDLMRARLHATLRALKLRLAGMDIDFSTGATTCSRFIEMVRATPEGRFVR
ncbi:ABC transporter substrate-binding protein [Variovorax sp. DXTD-1]|uniref:ABC transporter substrate-binding protein n=1 Tax=Variovorax sp. DXTD-1 TaxID=2495592 RepID=UPI0021AFEDAF|nr:ABC transporter substrate-binding protein [Variovorax sp. DXTD-1]